MSKYFSKLKGEKQDRLDLTPSTDTSSFSSNNPYRAQVQNPPAYQPPPGPPPSHANHSSSSSRQEQQYNPQAPPENNENLPPYHDWTVVPDTALFPPPPAIGNEASITSNASYDDAARAHAWCARNPVYKPQIPNSRLVDAVRQGRHDLDIPTHFHGVVSKLDRASSPSSFATNYLGTLPVSVYRVSTAPVQTSTGASSRSRFGFSGSTLSSHAPGDQYVSTLLPLFFATTSSPMSPPQAQQTQGPVTIYFEITPLSYSSPDATVSLGFVAKPYPPERQPGWHRASLAVHGDDGRRYVNDPWGGRDFAAPFALHRSVGIGMTFYPEEVTDTSSDNSSSGGRTTKMETETVSQREVRSDLRKCRTKVHFVCDGTVDGGWDVDEERDAEMTMEHGGVEGLNGEVDLYAAVGMFGNVELEIRFYANGEGFVPPPVHNA